MSGLLRVVASELTRLRRRSVAVAWPAVTVVLTALITTFVFTAAGADGGAAAEAPGLSLPSAGQLAEASGLVESVRSAATILGVVTLAFWAITASSDQSTGLLRLLVQAEPRRLRLLGGKVLALALVTAVIAVIAVVAAVVASPPLAGTAGIDVDAWGASPADTAGAVGRAWLDVSLSLLVWGAIGLTVAVVTRSATVAIAGGVGYVLVVEGLLGIAAPDVADRLPGATLSALARGGTETVDFGTALGLGLGYAVAGIAVAATVFRRRDITD